MSDIEKSNPPRPLSTASSQLSFSGGGGDDADEDNSSLQFHNNPPSSTCSSSFNLHRQGSSASQQGGGSGASDAGGSGHHHHNLINVVNGRGSGLGILAGSTGSTIPRTTTISTIAMESNTSATSKCSPTRLVIALLQTPHQALHLKIIELSPNLLKLPDNLLEAEDYVKNHSQVIKNLQSKQSPVEELLRQADSLIAAQKPRAEVYAAMADSLGQTWKDLNGILDERRIVLELAYNCHKVIQSCVERMNELHSEYSKFSYIPTIEDNSIQRGQPQDVSASLRKLKEDRADVLKRVSQSLDVCQQLLNKITDFNFSIDSRQLFMKRDVDYATKQVHRWLERLHDRRILLEEKLKVKRAQFEEMQDYLVYDKEISELIQELNRLEKESAEFSLGDSVASAEAQRDALERMVRDMKMLQERALLTARKLDHDEQAKGKFYQRSGLKQKIYEILGTVNDLITESIDFELSLVDAKEFFHLAEMANQKLDEIAVVAINSADDKSAESQKRGNLSKSEVNALTYDALSKGQVLLDSLGWDSPRTRGIRAAYENLSKRKLVIEDELEHLELLDEYNNFLESVNQAYQNILNMETSFLRQPYILPVDIPGVQDFQQKHDRQMDILSDKTNFQELLQKLDQIYPSLSEEEKLSTEEKVNQLKALSNLVVELMLQRSWLAGEWLKLLQVDKAEWEKIEKDQILSLQTSSHANDPIEETKRLAKICDNINALYVPIQQQLGEVHRSDPDLDLSRMEARIEEIIKKYRQKQSQIAAIARIRDICQAYKVKLDHHLLGSTASTISAASSATAASGSTLAARQEPSYFPVLNDSLVASTLRSEEVSSVALERIIREQLEQKLQDTLGQFFQPLITGFRQEILEAQKDSSGGGSGQVNTTEKTAEELSWERYFERLKESYVRVTKELEDYLEALKETCRTVEQQLGRFGGGGEEGEGEKESLDRIEKELTDLTNFRKSYLPGKMEQDLKQRLEHVLSVVGHEEPPIQAEQEERTLRSLCTSLIHERLDGSLSERQDTLTRQLTEKMIHNDLDMINRTLNELISELEHPCNYGNNLADAQAYLASFERFERTVETLRDKLSRLLTTAGMPKTDVKAQNLLGKLNLLVDRKAKRRELILLSLEYFKLIEKSYEHYDQVNKEIDDIIAKSKEPTLSIPDIEALLKRLEVLKGKEADQEKRLAEIERISRIIFDVSQEEEIRQHHPLRDQRAKFVGEITRVESDLTMLLDSIKSQSESLASIPSVVELELESQIIVQSSEKKAVKTETEVLPQPTSQKPMEEIEVEEELIVPTRVTKKVEEPTRPKSQEMCTQTSVTTEPESELDAKTVEYLKEKERMTVAVLEALRQSMSPLPSGVPPQTVEKETQFEEFEDESRPAEKVDRDTITQTISESVRSFETQTDTVEVVEKTLVEMSTETDNEVVDIHLLEQQLLAQQQENHSRRVSREYLDPMFVQPLKDLVVNEGEKVVLECKTTGRIQKLVWLKDGLEICNNPDYKTDFHDCSIATLTIDEALPEDSAIFTCRAFGDEAGHVVVETSGRLSIREPVTSLLVPPSFVPHQKTSEGEHGKSHVIQVKVEGNPLPTVQWFKDGQCIDTSPDYIITFNNGLCQVMFDELVNGMDDGVYTCVATNKLGDAETQVELSIKGDIDISKKLSRQPPRIIKPLPKNLMSRAGQRVKLECEWESPTDCSIVWIKDDNKILTKSNSSAEITMETPTRSMLVFNEAYPVNSGKYSILVRNCGGEVQSDCQIIVKGLLPAETSDSELNVSDDGGVGSEQVEEIKPSVKMPLKDCRTRVGEPIRLDCVIVGSPEPEVIWYKNGVPLKEGRNLKLLFHGDKCSLVIDRGNLVDNGIYSVSALNNCGEASSKCQVFVVEKTPEEELENKDPVQPPVFKKMIQDEMVTAGHEFELTVELQENPGVVTEVTWWKNNVQIKDSNRIRLCNVRDEYRLHFKEVDLTDKGNYMVKAVNSGGDARCFGCLIVKENFEKAVPEQISAKEIDQTTKPLPQPAPPQPSPPTQTKKVSSKTMLVKPPRFVIPLEGKMVDEGERNLSLKCKIDASPPATVKWTKNNGVDALESGPESNLQILYNERNGEAELKFSMVNVKDGGRYTCHASNEHGLASSISDLIVKKTTFPPVFSKRLQSITVEDGKRIYLEVDVFGKPSPQIQWTLNGTPIKASEEDGIALKSDSPTRHALIISVGQKDRFAGNYRVVAKNDAGEAESSCLVNIIGKTAADAAPIQGELSALSSARIQHLSKISSASPEQQQPKTTTASTTSSDVKVVRDDVDSSLVESTTTTTTIITSTEERLYERVTQVISPVPSPELATLQVIRQQPKVGEVHKQPAQETTITKNTAVETLVPGPQPEILVAPSASQTVSKSKNQVLQKVKKFEEEAPTTEGECPSGSIRIIPISTPGGKVVTPTPAALQGFGEPPKIEPILPPTVSPSPLEGYQFIQPPKLTEDVISSVTQDVYKIDGNTVVQQRHEENRSSRSGEVRFTKPSKFVPEKMRESDHDSEVESIVIPPKWIPPSPVPPPITPSSSAFVSTMIPPPAQAPTEVGQSPVLVSPGGVKSLVKMWPPLSPTLESTQQVMSTSSTMFSSLSTTSAPPPISSTPTSLSAQPPAGSRLSPIGIPHERARSPTPNKEALEMDKLWSKPIRFSSPITVPTSSIPTSSQSPVPPQPTPPPPPPTYFSTPNVTSSSVTLKRKPEVPPKPASSPWMRRTTPTPYSPVTSPLPPPSSISPMTMKPEVPPKPSYLKSSPTPYSPLTSPLPSSRPLSATPAPDSIKEPLYYVSTVSTPRTTPVPPQLTGWTSPLPTTPEVPMEQTSSSYTSSFHEKREFFESTTTSYGGGEETTSPSKSFTPLPNLPPPPQDLIHPSGISLLDQSFLPPPGEPPIFMYAPPPPKPIAPATPSKQPAPVPTTKATSFMTSSSSATTTSTSSSSTSKIQLVQTQQQRPHQQRSLLAMPSTETTPKPVSQEVPQHAPPPPVRGPIILVTEEEQHLLNKTSLMTSTSLVESSSSVRPIRRPDAPYIRPTKFVPVLDYYSSSSDKETSEIIKPKWKPGEEEERQQKLSQWRKVTYEVPPGGDAGRSKRRDSLSSLVDKNMQGLNKQFKANISTLSQGLCYNHMERKIQSDLGEQSTGKGSESSKGSQDQGAGTVVTTTTSGGVEDANPLIYFKYDFGYEFGIACPRAKSEPPSQQSLQLPASSRPASWIEPSPSTKKWTTRPVEDTPISLPIIHETSSKKE